MENKELTHNDLPKAVGELDRKLNAVILLLQGVTTPTTSADQIFNVSEAAKFINLSLPTVYLKTSKNEIPHSKRGGRLYFSKVALEAWVKGGEVKTNEQVAAEAANYLRNNKKAA